MEKYINAEALVKRIDKELCKPCRDENKDYNGVRCRACWVDDMLIWIDSEPTADVREVISSAWIPVSERLPSNGDIVICTEHFPQMDYVRMVYYRHGRFNTSPNPNDICNEDLTDNITAWMPLPTPYKEQ